MLSSTYNYLCIEFSKIQKNISLKSIFAFKKKSWPDKVSSFD